MSPSQIIMDHPLSKHYFRIRNYFQQLFFNLKNFQIKNWISTWTMKNRKIWKFENFENLTKILSTLSARFIVHFDSFFKCSGFEILWIGFCILYHLWFNLNVTHYYLIGQIQIIQFSDHPIMIEKIWKG